MHSTHALSPGPGSHSGPPPLPELASAPLSTSEVGSPVVASPVVESVALVEALVPVVELLALAEPDALADVVVAPPDEEASPSLADIDAPLSPSPLSPHAAAARSAASTEVRRIMGASYRTGRPRVKARYLAV
jgi:hypothetical protein